jgi:AraC-like DNA-binding protein
MVASIHRSWTTKSLTPSSRFDEWNDRLSVVYGSRISERLEARRFFASMESKTLESFRVIECTCDPCAARRGPREIAESSGDFLSVQLVLKGKEVITLDGETYEVEAGHVFIWDSVRPLDFRVVERMHKISVILPLDRLRSWLPSGWQTLRRQIRPGTEGSTLLSSYLSALAPSRAADALNNGNALIETTIGLLVNAQGEDTQARSSSHREILLRRVQRFISLNLSDAKMTPATIASANRISVRYLHWLFEGLDTSVTQYVIRERLERCRRELSNPFSSQRKVADIALSAGFHDSTHFARRFKQEYGVSPRAYARIQGSGK